MVYSEVILELLDRVQVLERTQVVWYAEALDAYGQGEMVIKKALHGLLRRGQLYEYQEGDRCYLSRNPVKKLDETNKMEMSLFWVLLDAMPYSQNFKMNLLKTFQLTYINGKNKIVQAVYIPRYQETAICRLIKEIPESEYDREYCRIAVLEDPEGLEKLQRMGFTHVLHIDQEEKNPDERMKILKTFRGEEAWRDI